MDKDDAKVLLALFAAAVTTGVLVFGVAAISLNAECRARWADSGRIVDFGILSGCRVIVGGRMIPESALRAATIYEEDNE